MEESSAPRVVVFSREPGFFAPVSAALVPRFTAHPSREDRYPERVVQRISPCACVLDFAFPSNCSHRLLNRLITFGWLDSLRVLAVTPPAGAPLVSPAWMTSLADAALRYDSVPAELTATLIRALEAGAARPYAAWKSAQRLPRDVLPQVDAILQPTFIKARSEQQVAWDTLRDWFMAKPDVSCPFPHLFDAVNSEVWRLKTRYDPDWDPSLKQLVKQLNRRLETVVWPTGIFPYLHYDPSGVWLTLHSPPH